MNKKLLYILPALIVLSQVFQPAGFHAMAGIKVPLLLLPLGLTFAYIVLSVFWPSRGSHDQSD